MRIRISILLNQDSLVQTAGAKSFLLHSQLNKSNFAKAVMANRYRTAQTLKMRTPSAVETYVPICTYKKLGPLGVAQYRS